jgi:hypothetical protein
MNGGLGKQKDDNKSTKSEENNGAHFITSAIEMETRSAPRESNVDSFASWTTIEGGQKSPEPYRVV